VPQYPKNFSPTSFSPPYGSNRLDDQLSKAAGVTPLTVNGGKKNSENQLTFSTNPKPPLLPGLRLVRPSAGFIKSCTNALIAAPSLLPIATSVSHSVFFLRPLLPSKSSAKTV
jgi:hypothetical protein